MWRTKATRRAPAAESFLRHTLWSYGRLLHTAHNRRYLSGRLSLDFTLMYWTSLPSTRLLYGNMLGKVCSNHGSICVVGYVKSQRFALQLQLSLMTRTGSGLIFESRELYPCLTPQSRVVMFLVTCKT